VSNVDAVSISVPRAEGAAPENRFIPAFTPFGSKAFASSPDALRIEKMYLLNNRGG
jgi:hypothetical protein